MKGWTVLPKLHHLNNIPVQLNHGQYDMVRPLLIADTAAELKQVECHLLPHAAHSVLLDSPIEAYGYMQDFLIRVENGDRKFDSSGCFPTPEAQGSAPSIAAIVVTGVVAV
ncbi:MAG: hypothetical protein SGARI_008055, partial [Bacillariaceae sp.]